MLTEKMKQVAWKAWCDNYDEYSNETGLYAAFEKALVQVRTALEAK